MPLPVGDIVWPPEDHAPMFDQMRVWRAWWNGDIAELSSVYSKVRVYNRPSQYRGGLVGAVARTFWGKPVPAGEPDNRSHVPVAADIASMSADLLFAEPPKLLVEKLNAGEGEPGDEVEDEATKDRLAEYVEDGLWTMCREAEDAKAALGGVYLRVVWDKSISPRPWLSFVEADCAVPEFNFLGRLSAVTFWHVIEKIGDKVVRLLERHERGAIMYGLYEGNEDHLGMRVPLTESPITASLADNLTDGDTVDTLIEQLTVVYIPNKRPNKMWRLPLGLSDYAGIEGQMAELDQIMTNWLREIDLAKAILLVPEVFLTNLGRGQGAVFEADRRFMVGVTGMDPNMTKPEMFQPEIRDEQFQRSAQYRIEQIIRGAGYSMSTFSPTADDAGAVTATEIKQRKEKSLTTRGHKSEHWMQGLAEIVEAQLAIDAAHFGAEVTVQRPTITFPDAVVPDPKDIAQTVQMLDAAHAVSSEDKVRMLHPDWDEDKVRERVADLSPSDLDALVTSLKGVAGLAAELGKANSLGGVDDATLQALWEVVMAKVVDENGEPVDPGTPDFAGAAEQAQQALGGASTAPGAGRPGTPAQKPPAPGGSRAGKPALGKLR